jgi:hypothetical protein
MVNNSAPVNSLREIKLISIGYSIDIDALRAIEND